MEEAQDQLGGILSRRAEPTMNVSTAVSTADFSTEVLAASAQLPVLVDFWAPWCGPCRSLGPVLDTLAATHVDTLKVVKVNTDAEPELASRYQIRSIPAVKLFRDGRVVDEFVGAQPLAAIQAFLAPHLGKGAPAPLDLAREAIQRGELADGIKQLSELRELEPENTDAAVELSKCLALTGQISQARTTLQSLSPAFQADTRVRAAYALAHFAQIQRSPDETDAIQTLRVSAAGLLLQSQFEPGLQALLQSMQRNRRYAVGQGREDILFAFDLAGHDDPAVTASRRRLAALLN